MSREEEVFIVYDGQCPFCSKYVEWVELKQRFEHISLVDARTSAEWRARLISDGLNINDGFVVYVGSKQFAGARALAFLSKRGHGSSALERLHRRMFGSETVTRWAYPILRSGRNITLYVLGKKPI